MSCSLSGDNSLSLLETFSYLSNEYQWAWLYILDQRFFIDDSKKMLKMFALLMLK
ncbi:hypothetical protein VAE151_550551 [Vibrio aestuarianus]|uniref:Uncharacterized protein n=1 Tax=Vibrio aestuarianus TaxID=28171 RepID=A0ABN8TRR6_9VIBR|nr:hypothetical protein VAE308_1050556 [Vibrio aestuarianus]CAH8198158.1 hypothetical protein VAE055_370551 [Vibrio aestuarianus]CAH8198225.1 hypothetical protein VAE032_270552 [Vibrio aestuarianus]CAH8198384.1 hypothetical protein VAE128_460555 [Vibrio aestuarianus]CAH8198576.1 hypothetical protein VAE130_570555 [Vibrio aestuarianus]